MTSKLFARINIGQAEAIADQIGMFTWVVAMLVIGLNLAMRLSGAAACTPIIAVASLCVYPLGLLLVVVGLLHLLGTAIRTRTRAGAARPRTRYARAAWIPLWYRAHAAPADRSAQRRPAMRFDHGQAWAWGVECLLGATIIQAAASLSADQPIAGSLALLATLIPLHVALAAARDRIAAHGHT